MAIQKFDLEVIEKKYIAPDTLHIGLKRADGQRLDYAPGQFITFLFPQDDGKVKRRSYSIATIPGEKEAIEVSLTYMANGIASEKLFNAQLGDKFHAMGPAGKLILKQESPRKLFLIGTGTGIAPYRCMLKELEKKADQGVQVYILLGVQYQVSALYADDFRVYAKDHPNIHFYTCLSREKKELASDEVSGYVQNQFDWLDLDPENDIAYLCGNPDMIDQAFDRLTQKGFSPKNIRREKYISSN